MEKDFFRPDELDKIKQKGISIGKFLAEASTAFDNYLPVSPGTILKMFLDRADDKREIDFLDSVIKDEKLADFESIKFYERLNRLKKSLQVIAKATTEEKIKHFRQLTINGLLDKNNIQDDEYELFVRILDELTDMEYKVLMAISRTEDEHEGKAYDEKASQEAERKVLAELNNMDNKDFLAFVSRLKGKGLIIPLTFEMKSEDKDENGNDIVHSIYISEGGNIVGDAEEFYINTVNGHVSGLFKKLLAFINL